MSHNPRTGPTMGRPNYKKPKHMADAELAAVFNRQKNLQSAVKALVEKKELAAAETSSPPRKD